MEFSPEFYDVDTRTVYRMAVEISTGRSGYQMMMIALVSSRASRTEFAQVLKEQLIESGEKCLLVLGQPGKPYHEKTGAVTVTNHLPSALLEAAIRSSALVVVEADTAPSWT